MLWIGLQSNLGSHIILHIIMYAKDYQKIHRKLMNKIFIELLQHKLINKFFYDWDNGQYTDLLNIGLDLDRITPQMFRDYVGEEGYKHIYYVDVLNGSLNWQPDMHVGLNEWLIKYNISEGSQEWNDVKISILSHFILHHEQYISYHTHKQFISREKIHNNLCGCFLFYHK